MRVRRGGDGRQIDLDGPPLARGGEAALYCLPGEPDLLAKVYHQPTAEHAAKLAALRAARPDEAGARPGHRAVAWPVDRLLAGEDGDRVVGCLVPRIEGACVLAEVYNPQARRRACPSFHYDSLVRTARNLAATVRHVHRHGCVVGDLNELNVLVAPDGLVTLVDADSFQVSGAGRTHRCRVGKPECTPPELQGADFAAVDRGPEHDAFALAVLVFQLLMQGLHPFAGMFTGAGEPPSVPERIAAGYWPYALDRVVPFEPIAYAPPWAVLPPPVQDLLACCFDKGHEDPRRRPDAAAWQQALDEAEGLLRACPRNLQHRYPRGLDVCPWCVLARQHDQDPFPAPGEIGVSGTAAAGPAPDSLGGAAAQAGEGTPAPPLAAAFDPKDPLPPAAALPRASSGGWAVRGLEGLGTAVAGQRWLMWGAAGAVGAVLGFLLVTVWCERAPAPHQTTRNVRTAFRSDPPRPPPVVPLPFEDRHPGDGEAARAEAAWREALDRLHQAQEDYNEHVVAYWQMTQDARKGRVTAAALQARGRDLRAEGKRLGQLAAEVQKKARLWQEAQRAAAAGSGP